jgi:hypothetical protein
MRRSLVAFALTALCFAFLLFAAPIGAVAQSLDVKAVTMLVPASYAPLLEQGVSLQPTLHVFSKTAGGPTSYRLYLDLAPSGISHTIALEMTHPLDKNGVPEVWAEAKIKLKPETFPTPIDPLTFSLDRYSYWAEPLTIVIQPKITAPVIVVR